MKKVVCELCEGTEFFKEGAMFVCRGCGTSYTAEQARALMQDVEDSSPAPAAAAPAPMPSQQLENILILASAACEAENYKETENYCNKALELDAKCYKAWFMKGKAAGWQSKIVDLRIEEAARVFRKAIDFAPEEEKENLKVLASEEIRKLGLSLLTLRKDRFYNSTTQDELDGFTSDFETIRKAFSLLGSDTLPINLLREIAALMDKAAYDALRHAEVTTAGIYHRSFADASAHMDKLSKIEDLLLLAIEIGSEDTEGNILRYKNLAAVYESPISLKIYQQLYDMFVKEFKWQECNYMSSHEIKRRREQAQECRQKIYVLQNILADKREAERKVAETEKQQRIEAYWAEHKAEKDVLESEKAQLTDQKASLENEILDLNKQIKAIDAEKNESVPSRVAEYKLHEQVRELYSQKCNLGVFAVKEKKQITEKITALENEISVLRRKAQEETKDQMEGISKKIAPLKAKRDEIQNELAAVSDRIATIEAELAKDRS